MSVYKDVSLSLNKHPFTKDIGSLDDIESIRKSISNILSIRHFEMPFNAEFGSNIKKLLFEPMNPIMMNVIIKDIQDLIEQYEPRVELESIQLVPDEMTNSCTISIRFNAPDITQTEQSMNIKFQGGV